MNKLQAVEDNVPMMPPRQHDLAGATNFGSEGARPKVVQKRPAKRYVKHDFEFGIIPAIQYVYLYYPPTNTLICGKRRGKTHFAHENQEK